VGLDDPATAAKYLDGVTDAALTKFVPAVAKGIEAAPEMACVDIANWYAGLAETSPAGSRAAMLSRARTYYMRFLELHMTDDLQRTKVVATVRKVEAEIAKLFAPPPESAAAAAAAPPFFASAVNGEQDRGREERNRLTCAGGPDERRGQGRLATPGNEPSG
jgi:hypothetical protein